MSVRKYEETVTATSQAFGVSASAVSRHLVEATAKKRREFRERRLEDVHIFALFLDTIHREGPGLRRGAGHRPERAQAPPGVLGGRNGEPCDLRGPAGRLGSARADTVPACARCSRWGQGHYPGVEDAPRHEAGVSAVFDPHGPQHPAAFPTAVLEGGASTVRAGVGVEPLRRCEGHVVGLQAGTAPDQRVSPRLLARSVLRSG